MNIEHISVSRSKSYKQCRYYYKLKYHQKIPNPGEEQFYFTYGKIIHKIAEVYVEEKGKRSLGEVSTDVLRGKIELEPGKIAPALPADYKRRMPEHLRSIQDLTNRIGLDGELEYKFRYDLDPPNNKFVTGFIDRLVIRGDKAFIVDYKTTKRGPYRETKQSIVHDPQLRCYSRVVWKEFGIKPANIHCALCYLEGGDLIAAKYSEESLLRIEKEMLSVYNAILEDDPETVRGSTGQHCTRCEYKNMCPFFQSKGASNAWDGSIESINLL